METPQLSTGEEIEALVLRRLRGELAGGDAERLAAALAESPRLAELAAGLERAWRNLELPPVAAAESVAPRVLARLRTEQRPGLLGMAGSPAWARVAAALALVAGLGAGWNLGIEPTGEAPPEVASNSDELFGDEAGFAEGLWLAAETDLQDHGELQ